MNAETQTEAKQFPIFIGEHSGMEEEWWVGSTKFATIITQGEPIFAWRKIGTVEGMFVWELGNYRNQKSLNAFSVTKNDVPLSFLPGVGPSLQGVLKLNGIQADISEIVKIEDA